MKDKKKRIYVIRHAESEGNRMGIVQGQRAHYPLSAHGRHQAATLAKVRRIEFNKVNKIVSSPLARAKETARFYAQALGVPLITEPLMIEVNPGVLENLPSKDACRFFPESYYHWLQRGDLDAIPHAETGDQLQARAIAVLYEYTQRTAGSQLWVTHAGFLRSLINTANKRPRSTPLDVSHDAVHRLYSPSFGVKFEQQTLAKKSSVFIVHTCDRSYVLKDTPRALGECDDLQHKILTALRMRTDRVPRLLLSQTRQGGDRETYNLKVFEYTQGVHVFGPLNNNNAQELINATYELSEHLLAIGKSLTETFIPTLYDYLVESFMSISSSDLQSYGKALLATSELKIASVYKDMAIVNFDIHRANLLWDNGRLRFIDLETFVRADPLFQLGSMLVASVLLEEPNFSLINRYLNAWPKIVDRSKLWFYMKARAFIGAAYFQCRLEQGSTQPEDTEILSRYLKVIELLKERNN
ncbi:MAG: histidine phosphatase family protein [Prochloraceae cyanobacterium]|nr:histidine phosphatase family protein [Prochloraceae cyanobacterium]